MGYTVIKPDPDEDFYVYWSSVVEAPSHFGPREYVKANIRGTEEYPAEERMARADATGTSALWPDSTAYNAYGWDDPDPYMIFMQEGLIHRSKLKELCERLQNKKDYKDLLEPLEDYWSPWRTDGC